jgi:hypothetical protein
MNSRPEPVGSANDNWEICLYCGYWKWQQLPDCPHEGACPHRRAGLAQYRIRVLGVMVWAASAILVGGCLLALGIAMVADWRTR